ncbi:hypothetical protein [Escherichia phage phiWec179]|nr:hypothetical protein [Escherichia phage phiWec179]BDU12316.1 hypothetical protein [Escherichia phage phiWec181]BDU12756.1 hypothetical protein [Escherichia phage phiWec186]
MKVLIGSRALEMICRSRGVELYRACVDLDYLCTEEEWQAEAQKFSKDRFVEIVERKGNKGHIKMIAGAHLEYDIAQPGDSTDALIQYIKENADHLPRIGYDVVAPLDVLYLLKMSHRFKKDSPHFLKTMKDIHFMRNLGAKIPEELEDTYKLRQKESYNYGHPNLNVKSKDFFKGDEVPYVYDHDSLHRVLAVMEEPAYTNYLKDGNEVMTSKDKFYAVDETTRLLGVLEESLVLASERCLIPFNYSVTGKKAFLMALTKVCTSITSGYFREYAYEKFFLVCKVYDNMYPNDEWVDTLRQAIDKGAVDVYKA